MDLDIVKKIIAITEESEIAELEVEQDGFRVMVRKTPSVEGMTAMHAALPAAAPSAAQAPSGESEATAGVSSLPVIESPMVATFYRSPAPDADPFVKVGDTVSPDTVVCILEAMKVMNEIKAGIGGVIAEILLENAQPVEYGQALFRVKPS